MTVQKRTITALTLSAVTLASVAFWQQAQAASALNLGSASSFAILAGSGITIEAPSGTIITGDIGSFPTASITGLENAILNGVNQAGNSVTQTAKTDLMLAYVDAAGQAADFTYADGYDLTTTGTLAGGVHMSAGSFLISGSITLDALGDSSTVWIFQTTASTLTAASGGQVILTNGALASNVFWQVGTSATLNTTADFAGTILADQSITMNSGVNLQGRALAINGAVTLGSTIVTIPEPSTQVLFGAAAVCLLISQRRRRHSGAFCS